MELNKAASKYIVLAQVGSDGGKGERELIDALAERKILPLAYKAYKEGYCMKDKMIFRAIELIARSHGQSGFAFSVCHNTESKPKYLVYFTFRIEGERYQISFHSFDRRLEKFVKSSGSAHHTRWDKGSRGKCRKNALALAEAAFM